MLKIQRTIVEAMIAHAHKDAPLEACGYLGEHNGIICESYPMKNIDASGEHFAFDPAEQFAVVKEMRTNNQKAAVVYHSHPQTPSRPSQEDIRLAFDPDISYVIVSLAGPEPVVKSFRIRKGEVEQEDIEILA
ncbi:MAG: hypothetical protein GF398_16980 [Chitinivibrionales bacterium]|nr:hypothetical protein [Chitinivibrionales bacterium]